MSLLHVEIRRNALETTLSSTEANKPLNCHFPIKRLVFYLVPSFRSQKCYFPKIRSLPCLRKNPVVVFYQFFLFSCNCCDQNFFYKTGLKRWSVLEPIYTFDQTQSIPQQFSNLQRTHCARCGFFGR